MKVSRRNFLSIAGAAGVAAHTPGILHAQQQAQGSGGSSANPNDTWVGQPQPYPYVQSRSAVSLVKGEDRHKNVLTALEAIDEQIRPVLKTKKYVVIKPNAVTRIPLGTTNATALMAILDYLAPRFKGPVVIAESSGDTLGNFEALGYQKVVDQYKKQQVSLVDFNTEAKYELISVFDYNAHVLPVRLAARLVDKDAYVICCALMKTHNAQVATLSLKNMVLGAPLSAPPGTKPRWSDKRKFHVGMRMMQVNMLQAATKLRPNFGAAVVDAYEGMEGNGPHQGTPVPHRIALASTDYIALDRVGLECMGIDYNSVGSLVYSYQAGLGQYDLDKIDVRGEKIADVKRVYRLHADIDKEREWMGPMEDLPSRLGRNRPPEEDLSIYDCNA
jgi:uncharacterized protein (DUF362 family)